MAAATSRDVAIVGAATAGIGWETERSAAEIMADASYRALDDAGLRARDVDGVFAVSPYFWMPSVTLAAKVRIPELLPASGGEGAPALLGGSFQLPGLGGAPAPSMLDERSLPVVVSPSTDRFTWRLKLPADPCPAAEPLSQVDNDLGSFHQAVQVSGRQLTVELDR